ncbi:hypothetical protein [Streptomyces sp. NPDC021224]|uniref:hypothetical protein n=1 Tax=unclassified Streptomyces TaxID=2593676 RepID=UPI0037BB19A9
MDLPTPSRAQARPPRRLVAAGIIRRTGARTTRITATPAGITGSIRTAVTR